MSSSTEINNHEEINQEEEVGSPLTLSPSDTVIFAKSRLNEIYMLINRAFEAGRILISDRRVTRSQTFGKKAVNYAISEDEEEDEDEYPTQEEEEYWSDESYIPSGREDVEDDYSEEEEYDSDEDAYEQLDLLQDEMEMISQFADLHLDNNKISSSSNQIEQ